MELVRRYIDPRRQYQRWIDARLGSLKPAELIAYLRAQGWLEQPCEREGVLAFQEPSGAAAEGRPYCQFVPLREHYHDYLQLVFELVTGLAEYENRQASSVIDDVVGLSHRDGNGNGKVRESPQERERTSQGAQ